MAANSLVAVGRIDRAILIVRGQRVLLDADLAALYKVGTRALVQAVKRNRSRFPKDFMLRLTAEEVSNLRSQSVISRSAHGGRRSGAVSVRLDGGDFFQSTNSSV